MLNNIRMIKIKAISLMSFFFKRVLRPRLVCALQSAMCFYYDRGTFNRKCAS